MQMKIVNVSLHARYQKVNNKLIILNNHYNIHLKLFEYRRKQKYVVSCKVRDRKTNRVIFTKVFYLDDKIDLRSVKLKILNREIPKEFKEIEKYVHALQLQ